MWERFGGKGEVGIDGVGDFSGLLGKREKVRVFLILLNAQICVERFVWVQRADLLTIKKT